MRIPDEFKIKTPKEQSDDLNLMYDFLFDFIVSVGWVGRVGELPFGNSSQKAKDQDGYIYCFIGTCNQRLISASVRSASIFIKDMSSVEEITTDNMKEALHRM